MLLNNKNNAYETIPNSTISNYNTNVNPLLAKYNNTNNGAYPLIDSDKLAEIRGSGLYNPAPLYTQTTDNGTCIFQIYKMNVIDFMVLLVVIYI